MGKNKGVKKKPNVFKVAGAKSLKAKSKAKPVTGNLKKRKICACSELKEGVVMNYVDPLNSKGGCFHAVEDVSELLILLAKQLTAVLPFYKGIRLALTFMQCSLASAGKLRINEYVRKNIEKTDKNLVNLQNDIRQKKEEKAKPNSNQNKKPKESKKTTDFEKEKQKTFEKLNEMQF